MWFALLACQPSGSGTVPDGVTASGDDDDDDDVTTDTGTPVEEVVAPEVTTVTHALHPRVRHGRGGVVAPEHAGRRALGVHGRRRAPPQPRPRPARGRPRGAAPRPAVRRRHHVPRGRRERRGRGDVPDRLRPDRPVPGGPARADLGDGHRRGSGRALRAGVDEPGRRQLRVAVVGVRHRPAGPPGVGAAGPTPADDHAPAGHLERRRAPARPELVLAHVRRRRRRHRRGAHPRRRRAAHVRDAGAAPPPHADARRLARVRRVRGAVRRRAAGGGRARRVPAARCSAARRGSPPRASSTSTAGRTR
jgi:hypothetical protein